MMSLDSASRINTIIKSIEGMALPHLEPDSITDQGTIKDVLSSILDEVDTLSQIVDAEIAKPQPEQVS